MIIYGIHKMEMYLAVWALVVLHLGRRDWAAPPTAGQTLFCELLPCSPGRTVHFRLYALTVIPLHRENNIVHYHVIPLHSENNSVHYHVIPLHSENNIVHHHVIPLHRENNIVQYHTMCLNIFY